MWHFDAEDWTLCPFFAWKRFALFRFKEKYIQNMIRIIYIIHTTFACVPIKLFWPRITKKKMKWFSHFSFAVEKCTKQQMIRIWVRSHTNTDPQPHTFCVWCTRNILDFFCSPHLFASWYDFFSSFRYIVVICTPGMLRITLH